MKRSLRFVLAVVLAGSTSLAAAQMGLYGGNLSSGAGVSRALPLPLTPYGSSASSSPGLGYTPTSPLGAYGSSASSSPSLGFAPALPLTPYGGSSTGAGYATPSPLNPGGVGPMPDTLSPATHYPLVSCHPGGCSGVDGTQYTRGAGNVMFGSNGKICQFTAPGAPLVCN
jgi:hypothetical protein